jgi:ArsR family transcriptional regulator, arsenate/arsenite/antimonite-responsive transcriptional repressor
VPRLLPVITPAPDLDGCCAPLVQAPLSAEQAQDLARRLKAIADPGRLRLLSLPLSSPGQEACTCDLTEPLGLSQPTVSHHLRKLLEAGLVTAERGGVWTFYRARPEQLATLLTPGAEATPTGRSPGSAR